MKTLSALHFNTLGDIIKNGTERAAQGLNEVMGESIQSSVPIVEWIKLNEVSVSSLRLNAEKFGIVTQEFGGAMDAEVMLIFAEKNVLNIVRNMMMMDSDTDIALIRDVENDAMCELGNIMINACLASITDRLKISMESTLPNYSVKSGEEIIAHVKAEKKEFVVASHVNLSIKGTPMEGKLFVLLNSSAIDNVSNEINLYAGVS